MSESYTFEAGDGELERRSFAPAAPIKSTSCRFKAGP